MEYICGKADRLCLFYRTGVCSWNLACPYKLSYDDFKDDKKVKKAQKLYLNAISAQQESMKSGTNRMSQQKQDKDALQKIEEIIKEISADTNELKEASSIKTTAAIKARFVQFAKILDRQNLVLKDINKIEREWQEAYMQKLARQK